MLIELRIRDFAVLDDLSLELGPGLSVLTGETGAGKSIIVGALSLLLGERASTDDIREGTDRAIVEGVFDVSRNGHVLERLGELGIESDEGLLVLKREVQAQGRNRAWVNGSPMTATVLGELGSMLVDLHGQHEHQTLLRRAEQRGILDAYAGASDLLARVAMCHEAWRAAHKALEQREARTEELESRAEFLRFQLAEIDDARLQPDEEQALEVEARRMEGSRELGEETGRIHHQLYDGEDAIADRLAAVRSALARLTDLDPSLESLSALVEEAYHAVGEAGRAAGEYAAGVEHDPARLEALAARRDQLFRLKRKYGPDLDAVLALAETLRAEVEEIEGSAYDLAALGNRRDEARKALGQAADQLTAMRREACERLAGEVATRLSELGLADAIVQIALLPQPEPTPAGAEQIEFRVSLNTGFEPRSLARIASGGELSRVMLALKSILAREDRVPSLVFDEIDAGIGGVVASAVARTLEQVAAHHQVFVITHLPQLASRAHAHLRVRKDTDGERAVAEVAPLSGDDRVREIARMLGGDPESEASRAHARELLGLT